MSDLRPMWEKICSDLGINPGLVHVIFADGKEARNEYGLALGWGGIHYTDGSGELPEVLVVFPYSVGSNGLYLDIEELRDTCYHELIHLLLRDEIEEEDVEKMADIINRRQKGWHFWCSYLRGRAIALGLGPPDPAGMNLWQYARVERKRHRRKMSVGRGLACQFVRGVADREEVTVDEG